MPRRKKLYRVGFRFPTLSRRTITSRAKNAALLVQRRPLTSFFISLGILLGLIVLSNYAFSPKAAPAGTQITVKEVTTYKIGSVPRLNFQAQIEKSGVVKIMAQTGGVVQLINVTEGQSVGKGANLINLASNYEGGNAAGIQAAIAQKQYDTVAQTYDVQKEIIAKQRDVANKVRDNADKLRDISSQSLGDTQNLVDLNQQILDTIDQNLTNLEANNTGGVNNVTILQTKELKSQFMSAQNQIKTGLRNLQYSSDANNPPQQIADLQRDITLKQLDMQEKSLTLSKDVARLQLSLAYINTTLFHPTAPFAGVVDRIYVRVAQQVAPGTPLLSISGNSQTLNAVVKVPREIAQKISKQEASVLSINGQKLMLFPSFVSNDATDGTLYSVIFTIPPENAGRLTDGSFIMVEIPVGYPDTGTAMPFVPLDAIFQTQEQAIVYVVDGKKAKAKVVTLGDVSGKYAEIISGLNDGDQIILNRNVLEGDLIKVI